jgi:hypothetical protein
MQSPKEIAFDRIESLARKGNVSLFRYEGGVNITWNADDGRLLTECQDNLVSAVLLLSRAISTKEKR